MVFLLCSLLSFSRPPSSPIPRPPPPPGKSTTAAAVAAAVGLTHVDVGAYASARADWAYDGWDAARECHLLDEDAVADGLEATMATGGVVLDYHTVDWLPLRWVQLVVVLRAHTGMTEKGGARAGRAAQEADRRERRGWCGLGWAALGWGGLEWADGWGEAAVRGDDRGREGGGQRPRGGEGDGNGGTLSGGCLSWPLPRRALP